MPKRPQSSQSHSNRRLARISIKRLCPCVGSDIGGDASATSSDLRLPELRITSPGCKFFACADCSGWTSLTSTPWTLVGRFELGARAARPAFGDIAAGDSLQGGDRLGQHVSMAIVRPSAGASSSLAAAPKLTLRPGTQQRSCPATTSDRRGRHDARRGNRQSAPSCRSRSPQIALDQACLGGRPIGRIRHQRAVPGRRMASATSSLTP